MDRQLQDLSSGHAGAKRGDYSKRVPKAKPQIENR
jgi:hypothetical protein